MEKQIANIPKYEFINVQDRENFDLFLQYMESANVIVADTETNGLHYYCEHYVISLSVLFPEFGVVFNLPFRHGEGKVEVNWTKTIPQGTQFDDMNWTGRVKKQLYLQYWFDKLKGKIDFQNLPIEWLEEVKAVWTKPKTHIYHNAKFDLHMLRAEGFELPERVEDTMLAMHLVNEDMKNTEITAPYVYSKTGAPKKELAGQWARYPNGKLLVKKQWGNKRLKWLSAMLQHTGQIQSQYDATEGELELYQAKTQFEDWVAEQVDPLAKINDTLTYATYRKGKEITTEQHSKQRDKIRSKITLDPKANMWMLPSSDVAYYAMLDVVLTWELREWCLGVIKAWDNLSLWDDMCDQLLGASFLMEANGAVLDVDQALTELNILIPKAEELQGAYDDLCWDYSVDKHSLASPKKLLPMLNMVLDKDVRHILPEWVSQAVTITYEGVQLKGTDKESLELVSEHALVRLVMAYRKIKASINYLSKWEQARDPNGLVHGGMNQDGTVSMRLSSSGRGGNWQNIPDRGYTIKRAIVTRNDDWIITANDYGQLEARYASYVAEQLLVELGVHNCEPTMQNLFNSGVDMHSYTRDMVGVRDIMFEGMSDDEILLHTGELNNTVDRICRQIAKTLNFGLLYSGTKYMVSTLLKIDLDTAQILVDRWRELFPAFKIANDYYQKQSMELRPTPNGLDYGNYSTYPLSGKHRKLTRYNTFLRYKKAGEWQTMNPKEASSKKVFNNIIQGDCGLLPLKAMVNFGKEVGWEGIEPFAVIHDAIETRTHRDYLWKIPLLMEHMADFPINPKLTVDLEAGQNWQELNDVHDIDLWVKSRGYEGYAT